MKIRIASTIALAAALALGLSGCSLIAQQATQIPYAPSDGIDVDVEGAAVRNLMLIADESGENFNVVFTGVNTGTDSVPVTINFVTQGSQQASATFKLAPGSTEFGDPEGDVTPTLVSLNDVIPGSTIDAYLQSPGGAEMQRDVPVLDGTLKEYSHLVVSQATTAADDEKSDKNDSEGELVQESAPEPTE